MDLYLQNGDSETNETTNPQDPVSRWVTSSTDPVDLTVTFEVNVGVEPKIGGKPK